MDYDVLDLKEDFDIEVFKTLINLVNDDFKLSLSSLEKRPIKRETNYVEVGERIQIFNFFLKKLKLDNKSNEVNEQIKIHTHKILK